jgi:hypothetical protein
MALDKSVLPVLSIGGVHGPDQGRNRVSLSIVRPVAGFFFRRIIVPLVKALDKAAIGKAAAAFNQDIITAPDTAARRVTFKANRLNEFEVARAAIAADFNQVPIIDAFAQQDRVALTVNGFPTIDAAAKTNALDFRPETRRRRCVFGFLRRRLIFFVFSDNTAQADRYGRAQSEQQFTNLHRFLQICRPAPLGGRITTWSAQAELYQITLGKGVLKSHKEIFICLLA